MNRVSILTVQRKQVYHVNFLTFHFLEIHLREGPFKDTPIMKGFLWVRNYQQSDLRIEPETAGWEAQMLLRAKFVTRGQFNETRSIE